MTSPALARYRDVLANGEFRILFAAQLASILGDVVAAVALMVLVYGRTHSPFLAALTMSLAFVPYLFGGVLSAAAVQRWPARRTLVACHLCSAVVVVAMATPGVPIAGLLVLLFVVGLFAPVFQGVRAALLPDVLPPGPPYVLGRSMMRMVAQLAQIVGYAAGGLLIVVVSARGALLIDAASFALSAALVRFGTTARPTPVPGPPPAPVQSRAATAEPLPSPASAATAGPAGSGRASASVPSGSMVRASFAGVRQVLAVPRLRRVLLLEWAVPACMVAPEALAAAYVAHLGQPASAVGWYLTAMPVGAVAADVAAGRLLGPRGQARVVVPAAVAGCVALSAFAFEPALWVSMAALVAVGLGFAYGPGLDQQLVDVAPVELRGAALAVSSAGLMFFQGLGFAVWGLAAEVAAIRVVIPVAAGIAMLAILAFALPRGT